MIKIITVSKPRNKFYVLFYKKSNKEVYKRTSKKLYDIELKRTTVSKFIIALEKGEYDIPKYSSAFQISKGTDFNQSVPITGLIHFKRVHNKIKVL